MVNLNPLVSIIIPAFNREDFIDQTVKSAIEQTYDNIEIIIVDNCSNDNTYNIVNSLKNKDQRIKLFRNKENIGPVKNWLKCVDIAKGEFIKILWSDDLISKYYVTNTLKLFKENVGFVYTSVLNFQEKPNDELPSKKKATTGIYKSNIFIEGILKDYDFPFSPGCAIFRAKDIRKNLLLKIPTKYKSDFSSHAIGNDLLLYLITLCDYEKFGYVNENLSYFRSHKDSISIKTSKAKLIFNYDLIKCFFVEKYYPEMTKYISAKVALRMIKFRYKEKFGVNGINDFFFNKVSIDFKIVLSILTSKLFRKLFFS